MYKLETEQKVYDIAGIKIGGKIGENPTVMIGSIFYKGDKNLKNGNPSSFDRERATKLISQLEEISDRTGLYAMLDVVCTKAEQTEKYLEFAANTTNMPLLIDAVSEEAAITGIDFAKKLGIIDRTVLNSINPGTSEKVFAKIKECELQAAIVLTYSLKALISSEERINLLKTLIPKVSTAGITKILVDTVVMDIATLGLACKAIFEVKKRYGYPVGCGAHNAISSWKALKEKKDKVLTLACSAIANSLPISAGADFVLYGPIDVAQTMFPAISLIDASLGQMLIEEGVRLNKSHPRFKIGRI